jgi:hypothetical protein
MLTVEVKSNAAATTRAFRRGVFRVLGNAAARATDDTGRLTRDDIRNAMERRELRKLSRVVQYSSDLKKRRVPRTTGDGTPVRPWRAGAIVWTREGSDRGLGAFTAYSKGALIRPVNGRRWLAFATSAIPKRVGRFKMTPARYNASGLPGSIGPLVFVRGPSPNVAYLVVKNVSVTQRTGGKARRLGKRGGVGGGRRKAEFIVAFILIRTTSRERRFDPAALAAAQARRVPARLLNYINGNTGSIRGPVLFSSSGSATAQFVPVRRV